MQQDEEEEFVDREDGELEEGELDDDEDEEQRPAAAAGGGAVVDDNRKPDDDGDADAGELKDDDDDNIRTEEDAANDRLEARLRRELNTLSQFSYDGVDADGGEEYDGANTSPRVHRYRSSRHRTHHSRLSKNRQDPFSNTDRKQRRQVGSAAAGAGDAGDDGEAGNHGPGLRQRSRRQMNRVWSRPVSEKPLRGPYDSPHSSDDDDDDVNTGQLDRGQRADGVDNNMSGNDDDELNADDMDSDRYHGQYRSRHRRAGDMLPSLMDLSPDGDGVISRRDESGRYRTGHRSRVRQSSHRSGQPRKRKLVDTPMDERPHCKFFKEGKCAKGQECPFNHDFEPPRKMELCRYYMTGVCSKEKTCVYYHGDWPCRNFHVNGECEDGENCRYSHEELTDDTRPLLDVPCGGDDREEQRQTPSKKSSAEADETNTKSSNKKIPSLLDIQVYSPGTAPNTLPPGTVLHTSPRLRDSSHDRENARPGLLGDGPAARHRFPPAFEDYDDNDYYFDEDEANYDDEEDAENNEADESYGDRTGSQGATDTDMRVKESNELLPSASSADLSDVGFNGNYDGMPARSGDDAGMAGVGALTSSAAGDHLDPSRLPLAQRQLFMRIQQKQHRDETNHRPISELTAKLAAAERNWYSDEEDEKEDEPAAADDDDDEVKTEADNPPASTQSSTLASLMSTPPPLFNVPPPLLPRPLQQPPSGMPPYGLPPYGMPPRNSLLPHSLPPMAAQGMPPPGLPNQGFPPGLPMPGQGLLPLPVQGIPTQGFPPGIPRQGFQPHGVPALAFSQGPGMPPMPGLSQALTVPGMNSQGMPPPGLQSQGMPPMQVSSQGMPPPVIPPHLAGQEAVPGAGPGVRPGPAPGSVTPGQGQTTPLKFDISQILSVIRNNMSTVPQTIDTVSSSSSSVQQQQPTMSVSRDPRSTSATDPRLRTSKPTDQPPPETSLSPPASPPLPTPTSPVNLEVNGLSREVVYVLRRITISGTRPPTIPPHVTTDELKQRNDPRLLHYQSTTHSGMAKPVPSAPLTAEQPESRKLQTSPPLFTLPDIVLPPIGTPLPPATKQTVNNESSPGLEQKSSIFSPDRSSAVKVPEALQKQTPGRTEVPPRPPTSGLETVQDKKIIDYRNDPRYKKKKTRSISKEDDGFLSSKSGQNSLSTAGYAQEDFDIDFVRSRVDGNKLPRPSSMVHVSHPVKSQVLARVLDSEAAVNQYSMSDSDGQVSPVSRYSSTSQQLPSFMNSQLCEEEESPQEEVSLKDMFKTIDPTTSPFC